MTACSTTPANSRRVDAPMALSTPYRPNRSSVSRLKNRPTTASTTTKRGVDDLVERVALLLHAGQREHRLVGVSVLVAPPVAVSIEVVRSPVPLTTSACTTSGRRAAIGSVGVLHRAPRREVHPHRALQQVARVVDEPEDRDRCLCRSDEDHVALRHAGVLESGVGDALTVGGGCRHTLRWGLVPGDRHVGECRSRRAPSRRGARSRGRRPPARPVRASTAERSSGVMRLRRNESRALAE